MLITTTILIWIIALALPSPKKYRRRTRASPERLPTIRRGEKPKPAPDPDEIAFLQTQKRQLLSIADEIELLPDGERKTRKQIAIDKQIFTVDKKLKRLYQ